MTVESTAAGHGADYHAIGPYLPLNAGMDYSRKLGMLQVSLTLLQRGCCLGFAHSRVSRPRGPFCRADLRGHPLKGCRSLAGGAARVFCDWAFVHRVLALRLAALLRLLGSWVSSAICSCVSLGLVLAQCGLGVGAPSARLPGRHWLSPALPAPSSQPLLLCRMLGQWQRPPLQPQVRHGIYSRAAP